MDTAMDNLLDKRFVYSEQTHAEYVRNGYHIFPHFLSDGGLEECCRQVDRMLDQRHPEIPPDAIICAHMIETWVWELATHPKILDMIERQIGPDITFWSSHLIAKAP